MGFGIPNLADAAFPPQADPDSGDLAVLAAGHARTGVVSGCAVTAQGTPNMTVAVAAGAIAVTGSEAAVIGANVTIGAAHPGLARFDLIVASSVGVLSAVTGTAAGNPVFPAIPASSVVLAAVYIPGGDTAIGSTQLVDKRVLLSAAPASNAALAAETARAIAAEATKQSTIPPGTYVEVDGDPTTVDTEIDFTTAPTVNGTPIGGSYDPNAVSVLRFTGQLASHVNHGDFWPLGVDIGHFWWDAWCAPIQNDPDSPNPGYMVSDGAGGDHALLWGFEVGAGDKMMPTGNVYPNTHPLITFGSDDGVAQGEWAYHAVGWDGSYIYYFIDGILTGKVPFVGTRRAGYGQLFVGGSDHNQWAGDLAQLRAFEDCFPLSGPAFGFVPERYFSSGDTTGTPHTASFLASYMTPGQLTIPDLSDGYTGRLHPGQLNAAPYTIPGHPAFGEGAVKGIQQIPGRPTWVVSDTAPFDADLAHEPTGQVDAVPPTPAGAKVYDSFNRSKVNLTHLTPLLGSTDSGSLGPLVWQTGQSAGVTGPYASPWGIISGRAVSLMGGAAAHAAWVVSDSPNADVRVNRRSNASWGTHDTGLAMRVQDASHLYAIYTIGEPLAATHVDVVVNNGGMLSAPTRFACPLTAWTTLRATFVGTTLTLYVDDLGAGWTQIGQITGLTAFQAATGFGLTNYLLSTACRYDEFRVFA